MHVNKRGQTQFQVSRNFISYRSRNMRPLLKRLLGASFVQIFLQSVLTHLSRFRSSSDLGESSSCKNQTDDGRPLDLCSLAGYACCNAPGVLPNSLLTVRDYV